MFLVNRALPTTLTALRRPMSSLARKPAPIVPSPPHSLSIDTLGRTFPYRWLRDSCQCKACVHESTKQKLHRSSDIPSDVAPTDGAESVRLAEDSVHVNWNDGHSSSYHFDFLQRHATRENLAAFHRDPTKSPWDRATISACANLFINYHELETPSGQLKAIRQLQQYGLLFLRHVSTKETKDDTCELRKVADKFSEIRPTFYGELWDVKNRKGSKNIAYTNHALDPHMDLLYVYSLKVS